MGNDSWQAGEHGRHRFFVSVFVVGQCDVRLKLRENGL